MYDFYVKFYIEICWLIWGKFKFEFVVVLKRGVKIRRFLFYDKEDKCVN